MRRSSAAIAVVIAVLVPIGWAAQAWGAAPARTSLTAVENDLMCVACHEPLAVSQSPQAESERRLISHLIALGDTKAQIEHVMVAQYGPSVLARPPAHGETLTRHAVAGILNFLSEWRRAASSV